MFEKFELSQIFLSIVFLSSKYFFIFFFKKFLTLSTFDVFFIFPNIPKIQISFIRNNLNIFFMSFNLSFCVTSFLFMKFTTSFTIGGGPLSVL